MKPLNLRVPLTMSLKADTAKRVIEGIAYTADVSFETEEGVFQFAADAVKPWREHIPVLVQHNEDALIGRLTSAEWTDEGWKVSLKIADTPRGSEALALAAEGAYGGLSMSICDIAENESTITSAACTEISLVAHPAVPTAVLTGVALSAAPSHERGQKVPENIELQAQVTVNTDDTVAAFGEAVVAALASEPAEDQSQAAQLSARPSTQPVPRIAKTVDTPYPHLFGGVAGKNSWMQDMESASRNPEGSAAERLKLHATSMHKRAMKLAVTTDNFPPTDAPVNQSYFYNTEPDPTNPLTGLVSTGTLPLPMQPMYVPTYDPGDEANLVNPHVEGVEPALGDIGTFARTLVEPTAVSGKVAATRETTFNPLVERIIWRAFEKARQTAIETSLGTMLNGLTLPGAQEKTIDSNDAVDDIMDVLAGLTYQTDASRYTRLLITQNTFGDLVNAKDTTGRRLLNVYGQAVNSDGSVGAGLSTLNIAGVTGRPIAGVTASYLIDPDVVHVLLSRELQFTFDYEVAWVRYGFYQASMMFVTDTRGIIRLNRATA